MGNSRNFSHNSNYRFITNLFGEETSYALQRVNLPGCYFGHINLPKNATSGKMQGDTITFNPLYVTIILDEDFEVWKDILSTVFEMREQYQGFGRKVSERSYLEIQDDNAKTILKIEFIDCMIESVSDVQFDSTMEDEVMSIDVAIAYDYYNLIPL